MQFLDVFLGNSTELKGVRAITEDVRVEMMESKFNQQKKQTLQTFIDTFGIEQNVGVNFDLTAIPNQFSMAQTRKFKHVVSLILYLQKIPILGKFVYYGCYCFVDAQYNLAAGSGTPVDEIDRSCKNFHDCYKCVQKDFIDENGQDNCNGTTRSYRFRGFEDAVTQERRIECTNEPGTCKRAICECDKRLALELQEKEFEWNILHHQRWGGFMRDTECKKLTSTKSAKHDAVANQQRCCGRYPERFLYVAKSSEGVQRSCCNGKTYDLEGPLVCCANTSLTPAGNCLPGDVTIDKPPYITNYYQ